MRKVLFVILIFSLFLFQLVLSSNFVASQTCSLFTIAAECADAGRSKCNWCAGSGRNGVCTDNCVRCAFNPNPGTGIGIHNCVPEFGDFAGLAGFGGVVAVAGAVLLSTFMFRRKKRE